MKPKSPGLKFWFEIDLRSLGIFRLAIAGFLLMDLYRRWESRELFFSYQGVSDLDFYRDFSLSLFHGVLSDWVVNWIFVACLWCYGSLLLGYRTSRHAVLSLVLYMSSFRYNHAVIHGGNFLIAALLMWASFLPLGARFSLDARFSKNTSTDPILSAGTVESPAAFALKLQIALIYFLSFISKVFQNPLPGNDWLNGTALYYSLNYKTVAYGAAPWLAQLPEWILQLMNYLTLMLEGSFLFLVFSPWKRNTARRIAIAGQLAFSIGTILTLDVGDIAKVLLPSGLLFWTFQEWDLLGRFCPVPSASRKTARLSMSWPAAAFFSLLVYLNGWLIFDFLNVKPLPQWARPNQLIALHRIAAFDQLWNYFWNGPRSIHSFRFVGVRPDGTEIDLEDAYLGGDRWRNLAAPVPAVSRTVDSVVTYYGILRFRYLDAFFNFNMRKPGQNWPADLPKLADFLRRSYEGKFPGLKIKTVRLERLDRVVPDLTQRSNPKTETRLGAQYLWNF